MIFSNAANFSFFLVYSKPLMMKYHAITVLKWVFLPGALILIPIGLPDLMTASREFPTEIWLSILYVVVAITFLTFLLNMYAISKVYPNVATSYIFETLSDIEIPFCMSKDTVSFSEDSSIDLDLTLSNLLEFGF